MPREGHGSRNLIFPKKDAMKGIRHAPRGAWE